MKKLTKRDHKLDPKGSPKLEKPMPKKKNTKKRIDRYNMTPAPVTRSRFAHQCREGLGPNILID
jgi:hypothetical protein